MILCLETGQLPIVGYALERMSQRMLAFDCAVTGSLVDNALKCHTNVEDYGGVMTNWKGVLNCLHIDHDCSTTQILNVAKAQWSEHLHASIVQHPQAIDCVHRNNAAYISWVWNDTWGKVPRYHTWCLPFNVWRSSLLLRTMNASLPVHTERELPLVQRTCPFCSRWPCDIKHALLQCPQLDLVRADYEDRLHDPRTMHDLLNNPHPAVAFYMHRIARIFADCC